jgi:broad specificity phosphatase PhoE
MRRHRETTEAMSRAAGWSTDVVTDPGWDEFDHLAVVAAYPGASRRGLDRRAFQRLFEKATGRWTGGRFDEEYAEPWPAFRTRVAAALDRVVGAAGSGETVVVVSSGGPIAAAAATLVDPAAGDPALARMWGRLNAVLVNSSVGRVVVGSTGPRLLTWNDHAHLAANTVTYR